MLDDRRRCRIVRWTMSRRPAVWVGQVVAGSQCVGLVADRVLIGHGWRSVGISRGYRPTNQAAWRPTEHQFFCLPYCKTYLLRLLLSQVSGCVCLKLHSNRMPPRNTWTTGNISNLFCRALTQSTSTGSMLHKLGCSCSLRCNTRLTRQLFLHHCVRVAHSSATCHASLVRTTTANVLNAR